MLAILGPTASGKSAVAEAVAELTDGEIVSVDSMQVYRGLDIGTAKAPPAVRRRIRHHMIDLVEPEHDFSVADFQAAGRAVLSDLAARGTTAVVAGGSGLHFRALVDPMTFPPTDEATRAALEASHPDELAAELLAADPSAGDVVDVSNPRRVLRAVEIHRLTGATPTDRAGTAEALRLRSYDPEVPFVAIGLDPEESLRDRIVARFDRMLDDGLLDEVAALRGRLGRTASQAVGYREVLGVVEGELALEEGREAAIGATTALARRQRTFFRRDPRIRWLPWQHEEPARVAAAVAALEEMTAWSS